MIPRSGWRLAALVLLGPLAVASALVMGLASLAPGGEPPMTPTPEPLPALPVEPGRLAADWQPTGGPYEQVIYALALGPAPEVLYAGTWGSGPYRSRDAGVSWQPIGPPPGQDKLGLAQAQVRALAVSPGGETIYLSRWGAGIARSTDGGVHWTSISGFGNNILPFHNNWNADVVRIDQQDPDVVYQATWGGVYTSIDRGDTWNGQDVAPGVAWAEKSVYALIQDPDSGTLYAGTFGSGVYRSTDIGRAVNIYVEEPVETWEAIGPPEPALARRVYSLAMRGGVLWAGTQDGVYRTRDGGSSWQQVITGFEDDPRARIVQALALDKNGVLYAGTIDFGVYRSTDGGDSWQADNEGLRGYARALLSLVYDPRVDVLYAATYGAGIYRRGGEGWEPINGRGDGGLPAPAFDVQSLGFAGPGGETLLAGTLVGGLYASSDRGQHWQRLPRALPVGQARNVAGIAVLAEGETVVIAGGTGIHRSTGGDKWDKVTANLRVGDYRAIALAQGRRDPALLFTALDLEGPAGIYRSRDGGATWELRSLLGEVYDLTLSDDDRTLFAARLSEGIFRSDDHGISWELLGRDSPRQGTDMAAVRRNVWQRWVLGLKAESLHVLALDGVYRRPGGDGGQWQPALQGRFETLMVDPVRPGVLYATSLTRTVPSQVDYRPDVALEETQAPQPLIAEPNTDGEPGTPAAIAETAAITVDLDIAQPYAFWVSLDDGASWQQASFSDRPLTVLALDPADPDRLLAGTRDGGVYYTTLNLPSAYARGRAVWGLIGFVVVPSLVLGGLGAMYLYFLLVEKVKLYPWQVWALLLRVRAWRLVSSPRDELGAETKLVAALAAGEDRPLTVEGMWDTLQGLGIAISQDRVELALRDLVARRLLTRGRRDRYRFALAALRALARRNFDRQKLIDEVRSANQVARSTQAFFEQAGFQVTPLRRLRLSLWPESPHYRPLGRLSAWLHIHRRLEAPDVPRLLAEGDAGGRDLGFVVLDHIPTPDAYQALYDARLVPLSSSVIQQAVDRREARLSLEQAIREGRGQEDLFDRREPLHDHLALYRRGALLQEWRAAIERDEDKSFWGLPQSGRTSALWWLRRQVSGSWVKGYVNLRFRETDWDPVLRNLIADLLSDLHRTRYMLSDLPELEDVLAACGPERDLGAGLDYLAGRGLRAERTRFVVFCDDAVPGPVLDWLREPAARRDDTSLVTCWHRPPTDAGATGGGAWLPLLAGDESRALLETIGARLGLAFEEDDLEALTEAAGGHPFLLRQLGSQAARLAGRPAEPPSGQVLRPGEWPERPAPVRVAAGVVIEAYLQRQGEDLARLWAAFSPADQEQIRLLAAGEGVRPGFSERYAGSGLLSADERGEQHLGIGLLARWLQEGGR